jgi:hypothetical protein
MEAERFQNARPFGIPRHRSVRAVRCPIDFNDQFPVKRDEIDRLSVDGMLAAKLPAG